MVNKTNVLHYGSLEIPYEIYRSNRKTLEISVLPDMRVVLRAPTDVDLFEIHKKAEKRRRWIVKQIRFFEQFHPRTTARKYISGETFLYLGRQYKLKIIRGERNVALKDGIMIVSVDNHNNAKQYLKDWYRSKAMLFFPKIIEKHFSYFAGKGYEKPKIKIRDMVSHWGSLSKKNTLTLNPRLVQASKYLFEYVIVHELCHLVFADHNSKFYNLLEERLVDYQQRKQKLELFLS